MELRAHDYKVDTDEKQTLQMIPGVPVRAVQDVLFCL